MWVTLVAALPCVALAVISAWWIAGGLAGAGPWRPDDVTLAEAIATRNKAESLRLISLGADPNQPALVRDGLLSNGYDVVVTPVEAAVGTGQADALRMLLANGAIVVERDLRVLRCFERTRHDSGVREILDARSQGEPDCAGVRLPAAREP